MTTDAASDWIREIFMEFLADRVEDSQKLDDCENALHPPERNGNAQEGLRSSGSKSRSHSLENRFSSLTKIRV